MLLEKNEKIENSIYHAPSGRFFAVAYQTTSTLATYIPLAMSSINDPVR